MKKKELKEEQQIYQDYETLKKMAREDEICPLCYRIHLCGNNHNLGLPAELLCHNKKEMRILNTKDNVKELIKKIK